MDFNNNQSIPENNSVNQTNNNYSNDNQANGMATASLVLGILAIISICCVFGSYVFGGIAITLALLSRGKNTKLSSNALVGTILSIIGMTISTFIIAAYAVVLFTTYNSPEEFMKDYESYYEEYYGSEFPYQFDYNDNSGSYNYDYNNGSDTFNYYDDGTYDYYNNGQPEIIKLPKTL